MKRSQILYPKDENGEIKDFFSEEAYAMENVGFVVGPAPVATSEMIFYRGFTIKDKTQYPNFVNMKQGWEQYIKTLKMSEYLPIIKNETIPTKILPYLDEGTIVNIMNSCRWEKVFIKSVDTSLFAYGNFSSVYPNTSIDWMIQKYSEMSVHGPFAIRKFIDDPQIFYDEQRYWVLNGNVYHPSGVIPDFVKEAGKRMYEFSGSHYFTIDVAGDYIVEVNPGESSDRGGDNPLDFFCEIFAKEFLK